MKKIINSVDGVQSITIDSNLGKVTVTGTVDSKTLVQKLQKAGKHAEPWAATSAPAAGKAVNQPNQPKTATNSNVNNKDESKKTAKEKVGEGGGEVEKDASNGSNKGEGVNNAGGNGGGGKKGGGKKGGGGGGGGGEGPAFVEMSDSSAISNRNMAQVSVQTGYSLHSAEYDATHMFSDENANNCHIM